MKAKNIGMIAALSMGILGCGGSGSPKAENPPTSKEPVVSATSPAKQELTSAAGSSPAVGTLHTSAKPVAAETPKEPEETKGIILPDDDGDAGPVMLGVKSEIEGTGYCALADLKITAEPTLALKVKDKIYLVDGADKLFPEFFRNRIQHQQIRVVGTPELKEGVLHLTPTEIKLVP